MRRLDSQPNQGVSAMDKARLINMKPGTWTEFRPQRFRGSKKLGSVVKLDQTAFKSSLRMAGVRWTGKDWIPEHADYSSSAEADAAFDKVSGFMSRTGDLLPTDENIPGCFSVPFWRAVDVPCAECEVKDRCSAGVDFRLTFGGRVQFKTAVQELSRPWYVTELNGSSPPRLWQILKDVSSLNVIFYVYLSLWMVADLNTAKDCKDDRERTIKAERKKAADIREQNKSSAKAAKDAAKEQILDDLEGALYVMIADRIRAGDWERIASSIRAHTEVTLSEKWHKQISGIPHVALTHLGKECFEQLRKDDPRVDGNRLSDRFFDDTLQLVALDPELGEHKAELSLLTWPNDAEARKSALRRKKGMLDKLVATGWVSPPSENPIVLATEQKPRVLKS